MSPVSKRTICIALLLISAIFHPPLAQADRVTLRNLETIDKTVKTFDLNGVRFSDGKLLGWGEIRSGKIDATKQAAFDKYIKRFGEPLYRIRIRLQNQDYKDILEQAESLYPEYEAQDSDTAYMVSVALMWSRLAHGQRARAVGPYLKCYTYLRAKRKTKIAIPGDRELRFEPSTGMTPEIQPIWFDAEAAIAAIPALVKTIQMLPKPLPPAARVYYASMAITAGVPDSANRVSAGLDTSRATLRELALILKVQSDLAEQRTTDALARLESSYAKFSDANRPLAMYWCGVGQTTTDLDRGLLLLLRIPALHDKSQPDVAAAALAAAQAAIKSNDADKPLHKKRISLLRRELLQSFPQSYHAQKILQQLNVASDDPS